MVVGGLTGSILLTGRPPSIKYWDCVGRTCTCFYDRHTRELTSVSEVLASRLAGGLLEGGGSALSTKAHDCYTPHISLFWDISDLK